MIVHLDRDSVAMGDDMVPHDVEWEVSDQFTLQALVRRIRWSSFPATIIGGQATWILAQTESEARDGQRLAVLAQQWRRARWLVDPQTRIQAEASSFRLLYRTQQDPDQVFEQLLSEAGGTEFTERRRWFG